MTSSGPIVVHASQGRPPVAPMRPNDSDLLLDVVHAPGANVRVVTDDSALRAVPTAEGSSRATIPKEALRYRIGRMDLEVEVDGRPIHVTVDLVAPVSQAESVKELVEHLSLTEFSLLAMPRVQNLVKPEGEGLGDLVENLREAARLFDEASQLLARHPPTRVRSVPQETPPGSNLTEALVRAIIQQPYALVPATPGPSTLPILGRHYTAGSVHAVHPAEDTDTPANRFVHGVGLALERLAREAFGDLVGEHRALADSSTPIEGYVSIRQLTRTQAASAVEARRSVVEEVLAQIRVARARLEKRVPVRGLSSGLQSTPMVVLDPRYARVRRALDLLRVPTRDHLGAEGLVAGISSLTTLYELYCVATIHELLGEMGFELTEVEHDPSSGPSGTSHLLRDGTPFPNTFAYIHDAFGRIELLYEPLITRQGHPRAGLFCASAQTNTLTPDIVVRYANRALILDAKFQPYPPHDLFPESVLKYLHGLQPAANEVAVVGLQLLHYGAEAEPFSFHSKPVTPSISTIPVHPRNKQSLRSIVRRFIGS